MVVGVCQLTFALPGVSSLKAKRSVLKRLLDRTRNQFNVAAAEVAQQDSHRTAVVAVAVVSSDRGHADSMLQSIVSFMEGATDAVLVDRSTELLSLGSVGNWTT